MEHTKLRTMATIRVAPGYLLGAASAPLPRLSSFRSTAGHVSTLDLTVDGRHGDHTLPCTAKERNWILSARPSASDPENPSRVRSWQPND